MAACRHVGIRKHLDYGPAQFPIVCAHDITKEFLRYMYEGCEGCFSDFLYRIAFTSEVNAISIRMLFFNPSYPSFRDFSER